MKYVLAAMLGVVLWPCMTEAAIKTRVVNYQQGGIQFQGFLAYDDAIAGKRPGIVIFPEWWGLNDYHVDWQMNIYGNAVHSFTNPDADKHGIPGIKYNSQADHRSWQAMQLFFNDLFGRQGQPAAR